MGDELRGGAHHVSAADLDQRRREACHLLHGVRDVAEHERSAGARAQHRQHARCAAVARHRRLDHLPRRAVKPRQQHAAVRRGVDAAQRLAHALVAQQPRDAAHRRFHVREEEHLVDVLRDRAQVELEGSVVLDPRLREALARSREAVGHVLVLELGQAADVCVGHDHRVGLRRHVAAATLDAEGVGEGRRRDLGEVAAEHVAVGLLCERLGLLEQVPDRLRELEVLGLERAVLGQPGDEAVPARAVDRAVGQQLAPAAPEQQLAQVALVAGVQDGVQQLGVADAVVTLAERVAELGRFDQLVRERRRHLVEDGLQLLAVLHAVAAVALGRVLDGLEHVAQERAAELAVHLLRPLLDATQQRAGELHPAFALVGRRQGARLARHGVRDADGLHARVQLVGGVGDVHQVAVDFHLSRALGQEPERLHFLVEAAQLLDGQRLQRLCRLQCAFNRSGDRVVGLGVVLLDRLEVLGRVLGRCRLDAVGGQHGACRVHDVRVAALVDHGLVVALDDALEELERLLRFRERLLRGPRRRVLQHLVLLGLDSRLRVALGGRIAPRRAGAPLGGGVLPHLGLQVFERRAVGHALAELLGGFG